LQAFAGNIPAKEDKENHKLAQQWYYDIKTEAVYSKLFPKKTLFEGANKNVIVFEYKGLKAEHFGYSSVKNALFNTVTQDGIMIANSDTSQL